ncbi:MAG: isoprenoid biosynthesis protein ElbB [Candidatus Schekmanbacteria bacterium]|nr:MAG: isoprenoid biosynthesis protein ElbB [Candidatus Schekmanbacteria bacterium]
MAKKIGLLLSGCGVYDGAEIHESVCAMLAIDRAGCEIVCMAPDIEQYHVVNHLTGEVAEGEKRNVLVEAARIARGNIKKITDISVSDIDALIIPGGFGSAKNLSTYAFDGEKCRVNEDVKRLVQEVVGAGKPVGAICISPVVIAKIFEGTDVKPELTIGNDADTSEKIEKMGATHCQCSVSEFHIDEKNKIVSTPAYMLGTRISEVAEGIEKLVKSVIDLCR